jgi:uncharacterized cupredoxin-like copper-binding protein
LSSLFLACVSRPPAPRGPNVVTITATDYAFAAPDTIPEGLTTFKLVNQGKEPHQAAVMGATDRSFQELEAGAMAVEMKIPDWLLFPAGAGVVMGADSSNATSRLAPGNYLIVCFIPSPDGKMHVMKGMFRRLVVKPATPAAVAAAEPTSDVSVMLSDYAFTLSSPLTAGTHTIRVDNSGPQLHELTIERLLPGKTLADQQRWWQSGMRGAPAAIPVGGLSGPQPGKTGWVTVTLAPGKYLLTCYVPDSKDNRPHIVYGMVQEITID